MKLRKRPGGMNIEIYKNIKYIEREFGEVPGTLTLDITMATRQRK